MSSYTPKSDRLAIGLGRAARELSRRYAGGAERVTATQLASMLGQDPVVIAVNLDEFRRPIPCMELRFQTIAEMRAELTTVDLVEVLVALSSGVEISGRSLTLRDLDWEGRRRVDGRPLPLKFDSRG